MSNVWQIKTSISSICPGFPFSIGRVWRYQGRNQNPEVEEGQTKDNDQKKKDKRTNNDLQNTTQKTKDRATRTP